jgi:uncharacterized membrane protein
MKRVGGYIVKSFAAGAVVALPVYFSVLLLLRAMKAVTGIVHPLAALLPKWLPAEKLLSLLLVLIVCFLIGVFVRIPAVQKTRQRIEKSFFERIPGYGLFRSLTQQLAGGGDELVWKPALAEIEEALVPAFIIEALDDGQFTVFVPAAPTPFSGSIYILTPDRVHPVDVPFTHLIKALSRWGSGSRELVAAMKNQKAA